MVVVLVVVVMRLLTGLADILGEHLPMAALQDPIGLYFAIPFAFAAMLVDAAHRPECGAHRFHGRSGSGRPFLRGYLHGGLCASGKLAGIYSISRYRERSGLVGTGLWIGR